MENSIIAKSLSKSDILKIEKEYRWLVRYRLILCIVCIPCMFLGKYMPTKMVPLHPPTLLSSIITFSLILVVLFSLATKKVRRIKNELIEGKKICFVTQNFKAINNYDGTFSLKLPDLKSQKINFSIVEEDFEKINDIQTIGVELTPNSKIFLGVYPLAD